MRNRQTAGKNYMKDIFVQFAIFYQMIQLFVKVVKWLFCVDLVKMIGKESEMDHFNVHTAYLINSPEI